MCGIWKVSSENIQLPSDAKTEKADDDIVLRLNDDGTFDPYTSTVTEIADEGFEDHDLHCVLGRGGCWEYRDETLLLAPERPDGVDPGRVHDTLLAGKLVAHITNCLKRDDQPTLPDDDGKQAATEVSWSSKDNSEIDVHLSIPKGQISIGKFMYPKKHKAFFEEPVLLQPSTIGTFLMSQVLGNLNARLQTARDALEKVEARFHKKDFHNRTFYLTATPHAVNQQYAEQDVRYDEEKQMLDIRVIPVTFHQNNTFSAIGTQRILRGRYGISGEERDHLWFQVSLFGAGRSAPGSVYSEGRLLSHDDRRGYTGSIQAWEKNNKTVLFVEGDFYYGSDLKKAKKQNSMGIFTLQEVDARDEVEEDCLSEDDTTSSGDNLIDHSWDDGDNVFQ